MPVPSRQLLQLLWPTVDSYCSTRRSRHRSVFHVKLASDLAVPKDGLEGVPDAVFHVKLG